MKKTLVVLMILAVVAGGVFAEGEFSWGGEVRIGQDVHFTEDEAVFGNTDDPEESYGAATLTYKNGGVQTTLTFKVTYAPMYGMDLDFGGGGTPEPLGGNLSAGISYTDDNYKVNVEGDLNLSVPQLTSLWGYYYFWQKQVKLDVAFKGWDEARWRANDMLDQVSGRDNLDGKGGLVVNVSPQAVAGLSVGFMLPGYDADHSDRGGFPNHMTGSGDPAVPKGLRFSEDWLKWMVIGVKYDVAPLTIGFLYANNGGDGDYDADLSLSAGYVLNEQMSAGFHLEALTLGDFSDAGELNVAASFNYTALPLTAGITIKGWKLTSDDSKALEIAPSVSFQIIPTTLLGALDLNFKIGLGDNKSKTMEITPAIYWNPKGDSISDDEAHMFYLKYTYKKDLENSSDPALTNKLHMGIRLAF